MRSSFVRLGIYLRFLTRRERVSSPAWLICMAGLAPAFAALYPSLLPGQAETEQMAATMANPAMIAMMGRGYGAESLSQASIMAQQCLVWFLIAAAILNIFLVNRHTRADEELGRLELFRALPVGRLTAGAAVILFVLGLNLLISVLTALLLLAVNIGGTTAAGAFSYGLAIGAVGLVFAGLTLLAAQLFSTASGVNAFSFALLGLFYIMRALGDVGDSYLSLLSPLGLGQRVEAFYSNDFTPLLILALESLVLIAAAFGVGAVRDHGSGLIPVKKGRAHASRFLRSPFGYAWRISQSASLGWGLGLFLLGVAYGSVCADIGDFVEGNEMMQMILGAGGVNTLQENYVSLIFLIMSMVAAVPVMLTVLRIHREEKLGRLDQLFSKSVPRRRLFGSFLVIAVLESLVLELLLTLGLTAASGRVLELMPLFGAALAYLPAIWALAGFSALLVGLLPRLAGLVWAVFGYGFIMMYFGRIVEVPDWALRLSPFGNIPQLPVEDFTAVPLLALGTIALILTALGLWGFGRRDIG